MSPTVILGILLLCSLTAAQEKKDCLSEAVITESIGCITKKFDDLLNGTMPFLYSPLTSRLGRHLQSVTDVNRVAAPAGGRRTFIKEFGELHRQAMGDLTTSLAYLKQHFGPEFDPIEHVGLLRNLAKIDVSRLKRAYGSQVAHQLLDYRELLKSRFEKALRPYASSGDSRGLFDLCDDLLGPELCQALDCLNGFTETQYEDGLDWVKCFYSCEDLPPIASCVKETFTNCKEETLIGDTSWVSNLIVKGFADFVKLGECSIKVTLPQGDEQLRLTEGGEPVMVQVRSYLPPTMLCYDLSRLDTPMGVLLLLVQYLSRGTNETWCSPEIQVSTSNYVDDILPFLLPPIGLGSPKCRNNQLLNQAVVGWHDHAINESCRILVTDENWNDTFQFPIQAAVDGKIDKDYQESNLTVKLVVDGATRFSQKIKMTIEDKDPESVSTCRSFNDPHIVTFDGQYYNNHYEGYFMLYKHTELPYQVQAIYQKCGENGNGTCNCAVAVQTGDDVIVVDKCRRTSLDCGTGPCRPPTKLRAYLNGELTNGTRLFRRNDGLDFQIFLPHGTIIEVSEVAGSLNALVRPSVYDKSKTQGLCGTFNGNSMDDLTFPDGTVYNITGNETMAQPEAFNNAWRVPDGDVIFQGVLAEPSFTGVGNYCSCHHVVLSGVQCRCSPAELVQACDMIRGEEITQNVSIVAMHSLKQLLKTNPEQKIPADDVILDGSHELTEAEWRTNGSFTEASAKSSCQTATNSDPVLNTCWKTDGLGTGFLKIYQQACIEDKQLTDSNDWEPASIQAARSHCFDFLDQRFDWDEETIQDFTKNNCPNACSKQGTCNNGTCRCTGGLGPDCSIDSGNTPRITERSASQCDSRYSSCTHANVFGQSLISSFNIQCKLTEIQVSETGVVERSSTTVDVDYITPGQVACKLPKSASYRIGLLYNKPSLYAVDDYAQVADGSTDMINFDSACYTCDLVRKTCRRREGNSYCIINGRCLAANETDPDDTCNQCQPSISNSQYQYKSDDVCARRIRRQEDETRERNIRTIVSCCVSGVIIIGAVILFLIKGRKPSKSKDKVMVDYGPKGMDNKALVVEDGMTGNHVAVTSLTSPATDASPPVYDYVSGPEQMPPEVNTRDLVELVKMKEEAMQRTRQRSNSGSSLRSVGMGAAGPVSFGKYARSTEDLAARDEYVPPPPAAVVAPQQQLYSPQTVQMQGQQHQQQQPQPETDTSNQANTPNGQPPKQNDVPSIIRL